MRNRRNIMFIAAGLAVILVLLWLAGKFTAKVPAKTVSVPARSVNGATVPVRLLKVPLTESAVGTVQAVHETTIASKLLSRVIEINIKAGQKVKKNDVLLKLDESDAGVSLVNLRSKVQQSKSSLTMAEAAYNQAMLDEKRLGTLLKSKAVSQSEYDKAATRLKSADADLRRAKEALGESESILTYATVLAPMDGIVIDKKVDVGDTVVPGQVLLKLFDPSRMQMVASVRDSLAHKLKVGQEIGVKVDTLNYMCNGLVSEIVPESSSKSRTFQVKVTGPCPPGIYAGMFGRIFIPLEDEQVLVIPAKAVLRFGQLEMVDVVENGKPIRRSVRAGRGFGDDIEILSGLREGEQVAVPSGSAQEM